MMDRDLDFTYRVKRSARHSISIQVTPDGEVLVRAPYLAPDRVIRQFVMSKRSWIEKHLAAARQRTAAVDYFTEEELAALKKAATRKRLPYMTPPAASCRSASAIIPSSAI